MIEQISNITHVSRFKDCSIGAGADNNFGKNNIIYAPNGSGKSTISDIIKSYILNDPSLLLKRTSKIYPGDPAVTIRLNGSSSRFANGLWSNAAVDQRCLVFDKNFINKNIHTVTLSHDHKKSLHGLIVGESAQQAREDIIIKNAELSELKKISSNIQKTYNALGFGMTLDDFCRLQPSEVEDIKKQILQGEKQLDALNKTESIKKLPDLLRMMTILLDVGHIKNACVNIATAATNEAKAILRAHFDSNIHGEEWEKKEFLRCSVKSQGNLENKVCALCGQNLDVNAQKLIKSMFEVFNTSYIKLQKDIETAIDELQVINFPDKKNGITQIHDTNEARLNTWKNYIDGLSIPIIEKIQNQLDVLAIMVNELKEKLQQKALTDMTLVFEDENEFFNSEIETLNSIILEYNQSIDGINRQIFKYKNSLDISKKMEISNDIELNKIKKYRSEKSGIDLANDFQLNAEAIKTAEKKYNQAKQDFSKAQIEVMENHRICINRILDNCGARYCIEKIEQGNRGNSTEPYIEYQLKLTGGDQDSLLAASEGISGVLSEGELNLLAFAFFMSIIHDGDTSKTTIIFDDPMSSIDEGWRKQVSDRLNKLSKEDIRQIFVLTHYSDFAKHMQERLEESREFTIEDVGSQRGKNLCTADFNQLLQDEQVKRIENLVQYIDNPKTNSPGVIQSMIRPTLECALKQRYYQKLKSLIYQKKWLRDYINSQEVKEILINNRTYDDLDDLCVNSAFGNHDSPEELVFNETEAMSYAQKTLDVLEKL